MSRSWLSERGRAGGRSTSARSSPMPASSSASPARLGGPRAGWHVHPLGRGVGFARVRARARGDRPRRGLGGRSPAQLARPDGHPLLHGHGHGLAVLVAAGSALFTRRRGPPGTTTSGSSTAGWQTRGRPRPTGSCRSTPPARSTGPATGAWSSSTTRSRRSRTSRARTTYAGSSSTAPIPCRAVGPILDGETATPAWLGAPVANRPADPPASAEPASGGAVRLGLYPVCLASDDARCSASAP